MFGRRRKDEPSGSGLHQTNSEQQLFAQLVAETRADPEKLSTIETIDRGNPGRDLDGRLHRLRDAGVTMTRPSLAEGVLPRSSSHTEPRSVETPADELLPLSIRTEEAG